MTTPASTSPSSGPRTATPEIRKSYQERDGSMRVEVYVPPPDEYEDSADRWLRKIEGLENPVSGGAGWELEAILGSVRSYDMLVVLTENASGGGHGSGTRITNSVVGVGRDVAAALQDAHAKAREAGALTLSEKVAADRKKQEESSI